jgi:hypothetical protein
MGGLHPAAEFLAWVISTLHATPGYQVGTLLLALVFLWSGLVKIRRPRLAALALVDFRLIGRPRPWQGATLGVFEVGLAVGLAVGRAMPVILGVATFALTAFALAILRSLVARDKFPCFCFGGDEESLSKLSFARTLALLTLAVVLLLAGHSSAARLPLGEGAALTLEAAVGMLLLVVLLSRVPRLLRWNGEVTEYFHSRARACAS